MAELQAARPGVTTADNASMTRKDFTQIALDVVRQATGEVPKPAPSPLKAARQKAGVKGAASRAKTLTPEQRADIARTAAQARWKKGD
jgi:hypothetical protein